MGKDTNRERMCNRKVPYGSIHSKFAKRRVKIALTKLIAHELNSGRADSARLLHHYGCPHCNQYHIGHDREEAA